MKSVLSIQSHVVFGHAGNSAAVFPMRRVGVEVWPLNAVQFSNHTQYAEGWKGTVLPPGHLAEIAEGIAAIHMLPRCDAVLTGYIGAAAQGEVILDIVKKVKAANPHAWFFCDPVMGHPVKGCKVAPGVAEFHQEHSARAADMMSPNVLELGKLVGREIEDIGVGQNTNRSSFTERFVTCVQMCAVMLMGNLAVRETNYTGRQR